MTRAAPRIIPLPASQMELQRARQTIRAEQASDSDLLAACETLQRHGDWMDRDRAHQLRLAVLESNGWHHPPARPGRALQIAAAVVTLALLAAIATDRPAPGTADPQTERTPGTWPGMN